MLGTRVASRGQRQQAGSDAAVPIQRDASGPGAIRTLPPSVDEVLRSPGQALGKSQQHALHARMGFDFSGIRIHHDARAAASARELSAHAYTMGEHVVFGAGRYAPGSASGERLLRHELAHVVQQRQGRVAGDGVVTDAGLEREADRVADGARLSVEPGDARAEAPAQALQRDYSDESERAEPAPAGAEPEHEVDVDTMKVGNVSDGVIDNDLAVANQIFNPYRVAIRKGIAKAAPPKIADQTRAPLDINANPESDRRLRNLVKAAGSSAAKAARRGAAKAAKRGAAKAAKRGPTITGVWVERTAQNPDQATRGRSFKGSGVAMVYVPAGSRDSFAHELGHLLFDTEQGESGHIEVNAALKSATDAAKQTLSQLPKQQQLAALASLPFRDPRNPLDPHAQRNLMAAGMERITPDDVDKLTGDVAPDVRDVDQITVDQLEKLKKSRFVRKRPVG